MNIKITKIIKEYNKWNTNEQKFIKEILKNNMSYLKQNFQIFESDESLSKRESCVKVAVSYSNSVNIIDFLISTFNIDISSKTIVYTTVDDEEFDDKMFYISLAFRYNKNLNIIKYLVDKYCIDITSMQYTDNDCLFEACNENDSLEIIKYLIEEKNINVECDEKSYSEYFRAAISNKNKNMEIVAYLFSYIEKVTKSWATEARYLDKLEISDLEKLLLCVINNKINDENNSYFSKVNILLRTYATHYRYNKERIVSFVKNNVNPLLISEKLWYCFDMESPYEKEFDEFMELVDELTCCIELPSTVTSTVTSSFPNQFQCIDYTKLFPIFKCNDIVYYGDRDVMYKTMLVINDIIDNCNFSECMMLETKLPQYAINLYVHASHTSLFDLKLVSPNDISEFIKFIHQYPTTVLSIDKLAKDIISYFDSNKINYNEELKKIFVLYKLKYIYVHMHNRLLYNN